MKATIGITSGDPAGVGLEISLRALPELIPSARWVLFAGGAAFARASAAWGAGLEWKRAAGVDDVQTDHPLWFVEIPAAGALQPWGEWSRESGREAVASLEAASAAALEGRLEAMVTGPVSKQAIGADFIGQTEFLAERAQVKRFAMAFFTPTFKVVLATIHLPLREAIDRLSTAQYVDLVQLVDEQLRRFQFSKPRIAVAAVNPHAGEGGMFGIEDSTILQPAVDACRALGIEVSGPHSADSLYYRAHTGEFDVVIAPYHDQGLAPVKLIAHGESTNVTLGLPYVRTSPDHGPAFAIAGRGEADTLGMKTAMVAAVDLVRRQRRPDSPGKSRKSGAGDPVR